MRANTTAGFSSWTTYQILKVSNFPEILAVKRLPHNDFYFTNEETILRISQTYIPGGRSDRITSVSDFFLGG